MSNPLVTCGVTAFNAESTIEHAIRSALAQHYRPIEIVVVDDVSSDATPEIVARLAAEHPEIRIYRQEINGGGSASYNRIVREARGEFIAFFDDDDESLPERIDAQLRRILTYERDFAKGAPVLCHVARRVIYPNGEARIESAMGEGQGGGAPAGLAVARHVLIGASLRHGFGATASCSLVARRSILIALGMFDADYRRNWDMEFTVRAALAGAHFVGLSAPLVTQTMTRTSEKGLADEHRYMLMMLKKHRGFIDAEKSYDFARHFVDAKFAFMARRYGVFVAHTAAAVMMRPGTALRRLCLAMRNIGLNRRMGRFYGKSGQ
jgi:glycosyltransferase involved in cell wall biosynthesis